MKQSEQRSEEQTLRLAVIQSVSRDVLLKGIAANLYSAERLKAVRTRELRKKPRAR